MRAAGRRGRRRVVAATAALVCTGRRVVAATAALVCTGRRFLLAATAALARARRRFRGPGAGFEDWAPVDVGAEW